MAGKKCVHIDTKKNIVVLNDEAHHCYRRKPDAEDETLTADDRIEAKKRDEEARVWISGIEAVKANGIRGTGFSDQPAGLLKRFVSTRMNHQIVYTLQKYLLNPPIKLLFAMRVALPENEPENSGMVISFRTRLSSSGGNRSRGAVGHHNKKGRAL
jgi:hypothetical protein